MLKAVVIETLSAKLFAKLRTAHPQAPLRITGF